MIFVPFWNQTAQLLIFFMILFFFLFFFSSQKTTRSSPPPSSSFDTFPKSLALGINFLKSHFLFSFSFLLLLLFCSLHSHFFLLSFSMISSIILMSLFSSYQNSPTKRYFLLSHPFFLFFSFLFFSFLFFSFLFILFHFCQSIPWVPHCLSRASGEESGGEKTAQRNFEHFGVPISPSFESKQ